VNFISKLFFGVSCLAVILLLKHVLFWIAAANVLINLWADGIYHNDRDPENIPRLTIPVHIVSSLVGLGLLIYGIVFQVTRDSP
jgi:hypothetical protein